MSVEIEFISTGRLKGKVVFNSYGDSDNGIIYGKVSLFEKNGKEWDKVSDTGLFDLKTQRRVELVENELPTL